VRLPPFSLLFFFFLSWVVKTQLITSDPRDCPGLLPIWISKHSICTVLTSWYGSITHTDHSVSKTGQNWTGLLLPSSFSVNRTFFVLQNRTSNRTIFWENRQRKPKRLEKRRSSFPKLSLSIQPWPGLIDFEIQWRTRWVKIVYNICWVVCVLRLTSLQKYKGT